MSDAFYEKHIDNKNVYFAKNICSNGEQVLLHVHNSVEFKFITSGNYYVNIGGEEKLLHKGEMACVSSRKAHAYKSIGNSENFVLVINEEFLSAVCPKDTMFSTFNEQNEHFDEIAGLLEKTQQKWRTMNSREKRGFVFQFLGMLMQYYKIENVIQNKKEETVAQILEFIEENYHGEITLQMLSDKFGYSRNYFSNLFNKMVKMNLREYLNRRRIASALSMIKENPEMPMWRVSENVGYESPVTFYRALKRYIDENDNDKS